MAVTKYENKKSTINLSGITVTEGQTLKIEVSPAGEDILDEECPEGQIWTVQIHIQIAIADAP